MLDLGTRTVQEAWKVALNLEKHFSSTFFKHPSITLEAEKICSPFIIFREKKNYISRIFENPRSLQEYSIDMKGLEVKKRDTVPFVKQWCKDILKLMLPSLKEDCSVSITRPKMIQYLNGKLIELIDQRLPLTDYEQAKTARLTYKGSLPAHMVVFHRRHDRLAKSLQVADRYNSGDRVRYVVLENKQGPKLSDRAEDPDWLVGKDYTIDTKHYLKMAQSAVCKLIQHHVPDAESLFESAVSAYSLGNKQSSLSSFFLTGKSTVKTSRLISLPDELPSREITLKLQDKRCKIKKTKRKASGYVSISKFFK